MPHIFLVSEIAAITRQHPSTIYAQIAKGELAAIRLFTGHYRVTRDALRHYLGLEPDEAIPFPDELADEN